MQASVSHQNPAEHCRVTQPVVDGTRTESDAVEPLYVATMLTAFGRPPYLFVIVKVVLYAPAGMVTEAGTEIADGSLEVSATTAAAGNGPGALTVTRTVPDSFTPNALGVKTATGGVAATVNVPLAVLPSYVAVSVTCLVVGVGRISSGTATDCNPSGIVTVGRGNWTTGSLLTTWTAAPPAGAFPLRKTAASVPKNASGI